MGGGDVMVKEIIVFAHLHEYFHNATNILLQTYGSYDRIDCVEDNKLVTRTK